MEYGELTLGQIEALVNKLGGLQPVMSILSKTAKVTVEQWFHVVKGDADPFCPNGWTVFEHKKQGEMKIIRAGNDLFINDEKIDFYLSEYQLGKSVIEGNKLRKELASKSVLNANVLDYLLAHPELIPDSWKGMAIFFWGTIYRNTDGFLHVRCLYFRGGEWRWSDRWLDGGWHGNDPAAVLAS